MTCRQLRGLRRVAPARPISAIVLFPILVAASCHATNGARAADDSTPALLAIAGMLDSLCGAWQADCHSVVVNSSVKRVRGDLPQPFDTIDVAFRFPVGVSTPAGDRWPITVRDLGTDYRPSPRELRVWLYIVASRSDSNSKGYTVAAIEPNGAEHGAIVVEDRTTTGWVIRSIAWLVL